MPESSSLIGDRLRAVLDSIPVSALRLILAIMSAIALVLSQLHVPGLNDLKAILLITASLLAASFALLVLVPIAVKGYRQRVERQRQQQEQIIGRAIQAGHQDMKQIIDDAHNKLAAKIADVPLHVREALKPLLLVDEGAQWALAHEINAMRYGWSYEELAVTFALGIDGAGVMKRTETVKAYKELDMIEQSLLIDSAEAGVSPNPATKPGYSVDPSPGADFGIELSKPYFVDGEWVVDLKFDPPREADSSTSFVFVERLRKQTYAIGWLPQRMKDENIFDQYCAFRIDRPTRDLVLQVFLPVGYRADGVQIAVNLVPPVRKVGPKRHDSTEENRVRSNLVVSGPIGNRFELRLRVPWPVLGRVYVIRWDPLSTEKVL